ncbi:intracellular hyaluronan-binding protein 4-like [Sphaeramia orbicularis]|uniref:intracellular hyaluronan-binding protein 4-like n=1 Tax=Sphaeramia orbicularis TaxID=375764 RepID=UPI00117FB48A|nr:intracellular hyaluronan-binding protein 4 [Sphaeramia orbicularis]
MLSEYGCAVTNRFGNLLDDDADPFDLISEVENEKERKKKKKEEEERRGKQKKAVQKESQKTRRVLIASEGPVPFRKQQGLAGPVTENKEGKQEGLRGMKRAVYGEHRTPQGEQPQEFSVSPFYNAESDLRRRGRRGGGYMRNPQNFDMKSKREYDRHSGTGISPKEKRGGGGPWNWGSVEEAASEVLEVRSDSHDKSEDPQIPAEEENLNRALEEDEGELVVQVAMEMSLDEWKALQERGRPKVEFNIRKAEDKIPSKAKVIHQSKHLETLKSLKEDVDDMEDEGNFLRRPVNDITSLVGIYFPSRPSRGGRGRGARGGPTSRPERVKPPPQRDDLAPNPDDPEAFPALSAGR